MRLRASRGRWSIVELRFASEHEPVTAGCRGLRSAARSPAHSLPAFNASQGACPRPGPEPLGPRAVRHARDAALRQAPVIYRRSDLTGMRAPRTVLAGRDDPGRGGYARVKCDRAVQARTVVVYLDFPAMPSASLAQGVVLVSRLRGAHRVWAVLH